jgi:hypothetical protein
MPYSDIDSWNWFNGFFCVPTFKGDKASNYCLYRVHILLMIHLIRGHSERLGQHSHNMTGFEHGNLSRSGHPNPLIYHKIMSVKNYIHAVIVKCKVPITKPKGSVHSKHQLDMSWWLPISLLVVLALQLSIHRLNLKCPHILDQAKGLKHKIKISKSVTKTLLS